MQQGKLPIRTDRQVGQRRGAVTAHPIAPQSAEANIKVLRCRDIEAAADATADGRIVVSSGCGSRGRIDAVAEEARNAEQLVVSEPFWFEDDFGEEIWSKVVRICRERRRG